LPNSGSNFFTLFLPDWPTFDPPFWFFIARWHVELYDPLRHKIAVKRSREEN